MQSKCPQCGQPSDTRYSFCGMCGSSLRTEKSRLAAAPQSRQAASPSASPSAGPFAPAPQMPARPSSFPSREAPSREAPFREVSVASPWLASDRENQVATETWHEPALEPREPTLVSGPSFLGLEAEPSPQSSASYLLEDEPPSHAGRYIVLLLLAVAVGFLAWQWQHHGYPWNTQLAERLGLQRPVNNSQPAVPNANTVTAETNNPAPPANAGNSAALNQAAPNQPQATQAGTAQPMPPQAEPAQTTPAAGQAAAPTTGVAASADSGATRNSEENATQNQPVSAERAPAGAEKTPTAPETASSAAAPPATKPASRPAASAEPAKPSPAAEKAGPKEAPGAASEASTKPAVPGGDELLVAQAERYLYGQGVPEDCNRAQNDLRLAASRANVRAQSILGTMYATGHCANRDLPTAYQWFAKALHQEPGNSRYARDLEVLWNQMTPAEKQIASRSTK